MMMMMMKIMKNVLRERRAVLVENGKGEGDGEVAEVEANVGLARRHDREDVVLGHHARCWQPNCVQAGQATR